MATRTVLVVETRPIISTALQDHFLSRNLAYSVTSLPSAEEAALFAREGAADIVICEHRGPGPFDGLELLRLLPRPAVPVKVILCAAPSSAGDMAEALELGCQMFFVAPAPLTRFCEMIQQMLQAERGFSGNLLGVRLEDFLEMLCFRKETTHVYVSTGEVQGNIYVYDGAIVHAECGKIVGLDAIYELLGAEGGEFYSQIVFDAPRRTIFSDWQSILMEGVRQKDEVRHALGPDPVQKSLPPTPDPFPGDKVGQAPKVVPRREVRILVVDDSRLIRKIVNEILQGDPDITVAGYAANGAEALASMDEVKPDLILLDWDMPVMTGGTALMHIMVRSPCPVVILSGFDGGEGATPFDLLCLGAVDFMRKPQSRWRTDGRADDLIRRVKQAADIRLDRIRRIKAPAKRSDRKPVPAGSTVPAGLISVLVSGVGGGGDLIRIVTSLPADLGCAVLVLHDMQPEAVTAFVDYLNRRSAIEVRPTGNRVELVQGVCFMHPALVPLDLLAHDRGFVIETAGGPLQDEGPDSFLERASAVAGKRLLAGLLSGAGETGARGLSVVRRRGGVTIAQAPERSAAPGMAQAALASGAVDHCVDSEGFPKFFCDLVLRLRAGVGLVSTGGGR